MKETKFKNTEVGVIPEDWGVCSIEEIKSRINNAFVDGPFGSNLKTEHFVKNGDVYVIDSSCVTSGIFEQIDYKTITYNHFETIKRSECTGGDIIIAKIGMNCGMCAELPHLDKKSVVSGNSLKITLNQEKMLNYIFVCYMNTSKKQGKFDGLISVSAQPALSLRILNPYQMPLPPQKEQERIAKALSDVDKLIATLKQLIEKKKNIKQGAMQELLSGKRRLPGFTNPWVDKTIGEICKPYKGIQINKNDLEEANIGFPVMNGGISPSGYHHEHNEPADTIIMSEGGNSCGYVSYMKSPFWAGGHCYVLRPQSQISLDYFYQVLKYYEPIIMGLRTGSGLPNIKKSALSNFLLNISEDEKEQTAIAIILSDMDSEISALESRLAKYQSLKQGMMQQLLTGKIRLI